MASPSLNDPAFKEQLQILRQTDNVTNWFYLLRTILFLGLVIGGCVWFDLYRQEMGWSWVWSALVFLPAIVMIGAGQHQLSGLAHEGAHHILFKNRILNELVSDLCCLFPLFSSTYHYRLQHLAHHQFVNDPDRDPDVSQLQTSGHWLPFPMCKRSFLYELLKQLWVPNLVRFILVRARYNSTGVDKNPYMIKGVTPSKTALRVGLLYLVTFIPALTAITWFGNTLLLAIVPPALFLIVSTIFARLPDSAYHRTRLHPVIHQRWMSILRIGFITTLFTALAWTTHLTGHWAVVYFIALWMTPLLTSFSFFMILRQLVQHGNADRGWITNTRVFFVNQMINYAVFPMGQDYHLPHHLYATIPHYRLRKLHEIMLKYPEYHDQAVIVEGYFFPKHHPHTHPTVLEVLGPQYAAMKKRDIFIDNSVLDEDELEEKAEILKEGAKAQTKIGA